MAFCGLARSQFCAGEEELVCQANRPPFSRVRARESSEPQRLAHSVTVSPAWSDRMARMGKGGALENARFEVLMGCSQPLCQSAHPRLVRLVGPRENVVLELRAHGLPCRQDSRDDVVKSSVWHRGILPILFIVSLRGRGQTPPAPQRQPQPRRGRFLHLGPSVFIRGLVPLPAVTGLLPAPRSRSETCPGQAVRR